MKQADPNDALCARVLESAAAWGLDYYRSELLKSLVGRERLGSEELLETIRAAETLKSDYYRSQVLVRIARKHELKGAALEAYMKAADSFGSSHYYGEAVRVARPDAAERLRK